MVASHRLNERDVASFIRSVTKQKAVVMNGLLITDSLNRSKLQIRSLTKHCCMLLGDAHQMLGNSLELIIPLQNITNNIDNILFKM